MQGAAMDAASPAKRRALAPLDANAMPSPQPVLSAGGPVKPLRARQEEPRLSQSSPGSTSSRDASPRKRAADEQASSPVGKKPCIGHDDVSFPIQ